MEPVIKILSWNINGLRTQKDNFKQFLDSLDAHVICFQETKITRDQLEDFLAIVDGYVSFFSFSRKRSGYSGVATYCKKEVNPSFSQEGLSGILNIGSLRNNGGSLETFSDWDIKDLKDLDSEGRCIITQHPFTNEKGEENVVTVINVYCPRADPDKPERALFKLAFYKLLRQRASAIKQSGSFVVIVGDLNTSHKQIDHCDPCEDEEFEAREDRVYLNGFLLESSKKNNSSYNGIETFSSSESDPVADESISDFPCCDSFKLIDTFRYFYPFKEKCFTCWNMRINARSTNYGTRIDYVLCDEDFLSYVNDAFIHSDIEGSDHCPVSINLVNAKFLCNHSIPSICTKFYPEFQGNQQKLITYFKPNSKVNGIPPPICDKSDNSIKGSTTLKRKLGNTSSKIVSKKKGDLKQFTMESFLIRSCDSNGSCTEAESNSSSSQNIDSESDSYSQYLDEELGSTTRSSSGNNVDANDRKEQSPERKEISDRKTELVETYKKKNSGWGFMMRTPAPPPLCSGHKEHCVLRTVRKKGPNFNKQFYACARGVGKEGDPQSQCNFFTWFNGR